MLKRNPKSSPLLPSLSPTQLRPPAKSSLTPAAMFGEDSCGRKVSLLNDQPSTTTNTTFIRPRLPDRSRPSTSSISSCTSREGDNSSRSSSSGSPRHSHSPPTPPLVRLDSQSSLSRSTPSPMTPQYGFEPLDQQIKREQNAHPYFNQNFNNRAPNRYPSMQESAPQPYYNLSSQQPLPPMTDFELESNPYDAHARTLQPLQIQLQNAAFTEAPLTQLSPQAYQSPSSVTANGTLPPLSSAASTATVKTDPTTPISASNNASSSAGKPPVSKKKYPCPHAARFSCTDTFTTSGHAARHGKKHTGEKNILCPTCNKAFTRKDNMKQHERTHKGGSRAGSAAASPVISNKGGSRKGSMTAGDSMDVDDGALGSASGGVASKRPKMQRSELSEILEGISKEQGTGGHDGEMDADGEGESPGLDALATAASEMA